MTVWARSDLAAVTVSEAHGGCGQTHRRPAPGGNPAAVWKFSECPQCEDFLRHDPLWAVTAAEIPETHDETKTREDFDKRGARDKDAILALALAKIAGIENLPDSLTRMVSGAPLHVPGQMECPSGHVQPSGMKFCGECGAPMHGSPAAAAIASPQKAAEPPSPPSRPVRLRDQNKTTLQALAREKGLSEDGTNGELVSRLGKAGVTNNDLARFLESRSPVAA